MSNKVKRILSIPLILTMLVLAACAAPAVPAAPAASDGAAAPAEGAAAPAEAAGAPITLRFATIFDANGLEAWQPVLDAFEESHPNITVELESTAGSGAAVYPDVLKTSMASGDPPDVFFMWGGEIAGPFIDAGQVLDLAPYYEKYGWDGKFAPWTIDRITRNGNLYGVPYHALGMGFWYRTDLFEQVGVEVPTTFAEQEAVCQTLKEAGIYCVTMGGKFGWHTMRVLDYFLEHHCGPEMHNKLNTLEESWNTQCVIDSYASFQKWVDNGWVVPDFLNVAPDDSRFVMYQGDAAMDLEGVWFEGALKNDEQDLANYSFYLPPTDHEPVRFSAFPEQWMISAGSKNPDAAAEFINFITSAEVQTQFNINDFANSATIGVNPDCDEWALTCRWREIILSAEDTYPPTDQAFVKELMDGFFEVQDGIIAKRFTPEEGAALMQQRVEEWQARQ